MKKDTSEELKKSRKLKTMNNEVIPGILEKEWVEIEKKLQILRPFAKTVHIDIIDGKFADNKTFLDPEPFKKYSKDFFFELHMMVEDPLQYLKPWADAGFKRFLGHIEKMPDPVEFVASGQTLGGVGLAIDGPTNIDVLDKLNLNDLDCLLVFTAEEVGLSGQNFDIEKLEKVKKIREKYEFLNIEVDGGINNENILKAKDKGANLFVSTSHIFNSKNPQKTFSELENLIK